MSILTTVKQILTSRKIFPLLTFILLIALFFTSLSLFNAGNDSHEERPQVVNEEFLTKFYRKPEQVTQVKPSKTTFSYNAQTNVFTCQPNACVFKSQSHEDTDILKYILKKDPNANLIGNKFTVVEAGALDGDVLSNSYFFETFLGWNAVLFEPSTSSYQKLIKNRPNAHNFQMALCKDSTELTFVESGDDCCNGLNSTMSDKFRNDWHNKGKEHYYKVKCEPLKKTLKTIGLERVEIFFLDVEGAELFALQGTDVSKIHYFIIEMDGGDPVKEKGIHDLLESQNFKYAGKIGDNRNELFENLKW